MPSSNSTVVSELAWACKLVIVSSGWLLSFTPCANYLRGGAPKSAIEVREGMTFLDLSVRQIEHLNEVHKVNVPFILMNSFNTDQDTQRIIQKYQNHNINVRIHFTVDQPGRLTYFPMSPAGDFQPESISPHCKGKLASSSPDTRFS